MKTLTLLAVLATGTASAADAQLATAPFRPDSGSLLIRCGSLITAAANARRDEMADGVIVIRAGKITYVASTVPSEAAGLPQLDLRDYTCLPGLVDMHTHLTDRPEDTADLTVYFTRPAAETLKYGEQNAATTLLAGFTGARNLGTYVQGDDFALRDAINAGQAIGPRIQASGPYLTIPHGGGDLYVPDYKEPKDNARFHAGVARGPVEFAARAQAIIDSGADVLKVIASGAVLAFGGVPGAPEMTQEEIAAVVKVAHASGKKVAAHAHGEASILMAIAAGVDTVEHASYLGDAGIDAALKQGHVAFSMDVYGGDWIDVEGRKQKWPEEFLRKNVETTEVQRQGFTKAVKAGAPIVFGTDASIYPHGLNARQFRVMVERGMTPMQAIRAATSESAKFMGWSDRIGSIEPGKFGDVIAVRGDPLKDVTVLERVQAVVKGGLVFKQPAR